MLNFHGRRGLGSSHGLAAPASRGQRSGGLGFRLREARNKALRLRAIPNICFGYKLRRSGEAYAGRIYDAALLHRRLHFI